MVTKTGLQLSSFSSAMIILLNLAHARRAGSYIYVRKETERIQTCVNDLVIVAKRWADQSFFPRIYSPFPTPRWNPADRFM